ncbi:hypothetical protein ACFV4L_29460, partial [Streptomyces antimycoticus]
HPARPPGAATRRGHPARPPGAATRRGHPARPPGAATLGYAWVAAPHLEASADCNVPVGEELVGLRNGRWLRTVHALRTGERAAVAG